MQGDLMTFLVGLAQVLRVLDDLRTDDKEGGLDAVLAEEFKDPGRLGARAIIVCDCPVASIRAESDNWQHIWIIQVVAGCELGNWSRLDIHSGPRTRELSGSQLQEAEDADSSDRVHLS